MEKKRLRNISIQKVLDVFKLANFYSLHFTVLPRWSVAPSEDATGQLECFHTRYKKIIELRSLTSTIQRDQFDFLGIQKTKTVFKGELLVLASSIRVLE